MNSYGLASFKWYDKPDANGISAEGVYRLGGQAPGFKASEPMGVVDFLEGVWNTVGRLYVPDVLTIDISVGAAVARGRGATWSLNLITRGPDAGFHRTNTHQDVYGLEISYGLNFGAMQYSGLVSDLNANTLNGPTLTISGGLGAGGNLVYGYPNSQTPFSRPTLTGFSLGFGDTVGASVALRTNNVRIISISRLINPYLHKNHLM